MRADLNINLFTSQALMGDSEMLGSTGTLLPDGRDFMHGWFYRLRIRPEGSHQAKAATDVLLQTTGKCVARGFPITRVGGQEGMVAYHVDPATECEECDNNAQCPVANLITRNAAIPLRPFVGHRVHMEDIEKSQI